MTERKLSSYVADVVLKGDVLYMCYKSAPLEIHHVKEFVAAIKAEFADVLPILMLADISQQKSPKKEVRDYMSAPEVMEMSIADAVVANSLLSKIVGNLYLSFNKPSIPTKIFSDEASALKWLEQFRK